MFISYIIDPSPSHPMDIVIWPKSSPAGRDFPSIFRDRCRDQEAGCHSGTRACDFFSARKGLSVRRTGNGDWSNKNDDDLRFDLEWGIPRTPSHPGCGILGIAVDDY